MDTKRCHVVSLAVIQSLVFSSFQEGIIRKKSEFLKFFLLVSKIFNNNKVKVLNSFHLTVYFPNVYQKYSLHVVRYGGMCL